MLALFDVVFKKNWGVGFTVVQSANDDLEVTDCADFTPDLNIGCLLIYFVVPLNPPGRSRLGFRISKFKKKKKNSLGLQFSH
jgi:hypothetical protein